MAKNSARWKNKKSMVIGVSVLVAVSGYFLYTSIPVFENSSEQAASVQEANIQSDRNVPDGFHEYRSERYLFSILYPEDTSVEEYSEKAQGYTITFQDIEQGFGFQVFVVPYGAKQVQEERFRQDIPSGVRKNVVGVTVDGASGAAFESFDEALGETYEVWFIREGYLYEVTTLLPLRENMHKILDTWRFI